MYGIYIIAIALAGVAVAFGITTLIVWLVAYRYKPKYDEAKEKYRQVHWNDSEYNTILKEYKLWENKWLDTDKHIIPLFKHFCVSASIAVIFAFSGAMALKGSEEQYERFIATQEVFEQVYVAENEFENISLTKNILEMNEWLVEAKANKKIDGCFSRYYYLDLDALQPIGKRDREEE